MSTDLETRVAGIPAIVKVLYWTPLIPAKIYGPPENCYPAEGGDVEIEICDRRGRYAPWLEAKLSADDRSELEDWAWKEINEMEEFV